MNIEITPKLRETLATTVTNSSSLLLNLLLIVQVVLSASIAWKLNRVEQILIESTNNSNQGSLPVFVGTVSEDDDPARGSPSASVVVVEFSDYECPFCKEAQSGIQDILAAYGDRIRFVFRDFPLEHIHPNAFLAAQAAQCAGEQDRYWEMHDALFQNQDALALENLKQYASELGLNRQLFDNCLESGKFAEEVRKDIQDGRSYGVNGTPTFFVNGTRVVGFEQLRQNIELELAKKGN